MFRYYFAVRCNNYQLMFYIILQVLNCISNFQLGHSDS